MQKTFTLFLLFIICLGKPVKTVAQVIPADSLALVALYNSTGGASWTNNSGWLAGPVVNWYGVSLNGSSVSGIVLSSNNLIGTIPATFGSSNMGNLTDLELDNNNLSGSIPTSFNNLTNLFTLVLGNNQLSGSLPTLSSLIHLSYLVLGNNNLTGSIPATFGNLTSLGLLDLSTNQLSGSIPYSIGNLVNLNSLYLYNNNLSSTIPGTLGKLTALTDLELYSNQLSGAIPDSLKTLLALNTLDLSSNQLSSTIPSTLSNLINLNELNLYSNQLTGSIPASLGSISSLNNLNLSYNQLSGTIPSAIGNPSSLNILNLGSNQLSGTIPSSLGNTSLFSLDLSFNQLSGTVPSSFTNLTSAFTYINNNNLTFDGLETVVPAIHSALLDYPQDSLPLHLTGNILSVYAGGTLSKNTYKWYRNGGLVATNVGDSTYNYTLSGSGYYSVVISNSIVTPSSTLQLNSNIIIAGSILPVTFINFSGALVNNNTLLQWQTSSEINTSYFNVQRSLDGINFTTIGKVKAAINSSATENYNYTDNLSSSNVQSSRVFYRLQEIDKNNTGTYTNVIKVELNKQGSLFTIYPNPVKDVINISVGNNSGNALITICDLSGRRLFGQSQLLQQNAKVTINAANLTTGIYIIRATINGLTTQQKFLKE